MKLLKKLIAVLAFAPAMVLANSGTFPLDRAPDRSTDMAALQNGAKLFVNYCLNCHSASAMRYNRLKDIGLTDEQIKQNLLFTGEKVGDLMKTTLSAKDAKDWFGAVPPDLSVIARAKASGDGTGADWIYTYLRTYYRDQTRPTGWNNAVFENVGMPHVLWELQGAKRGATVVEVKEVKTADGKANGFAETTVTFDEQGNRTEHTEALKGEHHHVGKEPIKLGLASGGTMSRLEYDNAVGDLVAYLQWMGEPAQNTRRRLGVWVLLFLATLATLAWRLNASYWKEVK
ncbi:cytochrome c [Undibacterium sp. KW1]|uniref:cytochrome c1 n=1 Tax=Undibacterium sp. KW1 TaxID=2058624 RepID=UPI001331E05A|nr:cytochrome c1 [Undibacterium sp. KW1]BBB63209.1 cytochrome c [Undibacterium sp. KW1]